MAYYFATITADYCTPYDNNDYTRLLNALCQAGWTYAETSALYIESDSIAPISLALEILARSAHRPGDVSALTLNVQLIGEERRPPGAVNHRQALGNVLRRRLPSEE